MTALPRLVCVGWLCAAVAVSAGLGLGEGPQGTLRLTLRKRVETAPAGGSSQAVEQQAVWEAKKTAVIVCDMWARHWCAGARRRGAEMAPRINQLLQEARKQGVLVIHAPSGAMDLYKDHAARKRAQAAPKAANLPKDIAGWCSQIAAEKKGKYPVDQADGGCDDLPPCDVKSQMDLHQTPVLEIRDEDALSDSGVEIWNLMEQRGIANVMLLGVHTNMCVLGRPFGLRNMARFGKNVLLVRDLTDTMYNPRAWPQVSHFRGTELIVEHIEKYVCPTITSDQILGGKPFGFSGDTSDPGAASMRNQPSTSRAAPRLLKRLVFLSHPYAWECQFCGNPEAAARPRYAGYTGAELVAMERRVSRLWPDEIRRLGPEDALVVNGAGWGHPKLAMIDGSLRPAWEAAQKHVGDRLLITVSDPGESYGRKILEEFRSRGYAFDPRALAGEGWGQSFEGCLPRWAGGIAAAIGMPRGIPMRYDMTFPDAPFAMTGKFVDRLAIGQTDVCLYLFASRDERPFGIFFPGVIPDNEPPRFARFAVDPKKVEFTTKRAEPYPIRAQGRTFAVPLNIDGRGDPVYVWSKGLAAREFRSALAAARVGGLRD